MVGTYKFGQFRSNQITDYMKSIQYTLNNKQVKSSLSEGMTFVDKAIDLSGANQFQSTTDQGNLKSYYVRVKIYKDTDIQNFNVILKNTLLLTDNTQTLGSVQVPAGAADDFSIFDFVFSPNENRTFNEIHFELQRTVADYNKKNDDGTYGRIVKLEVEKLAEINNIIDTLNPSIDNTGVLKQIGVQSAPGLVMCINGEQIKVGRSGQYEIKNSSIQVHFLGFVVENNDKIFILDYQY